MLQVQPRLLLGIYNHGHKDTCSFCIRPTVESCSIPELHPLQPSVSLCAVGAWISRMSSSIMQSVVQCICSVPQQKSPGILQASTVPGGKQPLSPKQTTMECWNSLPARKPRMLRNMFWGPFSTKCRGLYKIWKGLIHYAKH